MEIRWLHWRLIFTVILLDFVEQSCHKFQFIIGIDKIFKLAVNTLSAFINTNYNCRSYTYIMACGKSITFTTITI